MYFHTKKKQFSPILYVHIGVVGQAGLISPAVASGRSPQVSPARIPLGVDLHSPPHPSSGVLVRPIPQQPSSIRVCIY